MRILSILLLLLVQSDAPAFDQLVVNYDYPRATSLDFQQRNVEKRGNALVIDLEYSGRSHTDHVPAYLVIPPGDGPFAAILWGHWMKQGSPLRNREEFLEEALVLARSGVMSLLIDSPMVRPDYKSKSIDEDPLDWAIQSSEDDRQMVVDLRRGVDLLLSRRHVDPRRIAYVGHSFSAHAGAILAAVEKRISCLVLMAGSFADEEYVRAAKDAGVVQWREKLGAQKMDQYFRDYAWDDPVNFINHTDGKSILLQFASGDAITEPQAKQLLERFSAKDKQMQFYQASHALNAAARLDRVHWLQQRLKLKKVDEQALKRIPQLK